MSLPPFEASVMASSIHRNSPFGSEIELGGELVDPRVTHRVVLAEQGAEARLAGVEAVVRPVVATPGVTKAAGSSEPSLFPGSPDR
jgi:hypothetical protein